MRFLNFLLLIFFVAAVVAVPQQAMSAITFTLGDVWVDTSSGPASGTVPISLDVTGLDLGADAAAFALRISVTSADGTLVPSDIVWSIPVYPGPSQLIPADSSNFGGSTNAGTNAYASDINSGLFSPANVPGGLFNGAMLADAGFTIAAGEEGTATVAFELASLSDATFTTLTVGTGTGTIHAVPEPSSMALLAVAGLVVVGGRRVVKRRKKA